MTFNDIVTEILNESLAINKSSTYLDYCNILRNRLGVFADRDLEQITKNDLLEYRSNLIASPNARNTSAMTWSMLGKVLAYANYEYGIDKAYRYFKSIRSISRVPTHKDSWNRQEWDTFISKVYQIYRETGRDDHYIYYVLFNYLFYMANRKGEATALKVNKLDLRRRIAVIDTNISYKVLPGQRTTGKTYITTDRKNHKDLIEAIPHRLISILELYPGRLYRTLRLEAGRLSIL